MQKATRDCQVFARVSAAEKAAIVAAAAAAYQKPGAWLRQIALEKANGHGKKGKGR